MIVERKVDLGKVLKCSSKYLLASLALVELCLAMSADCLASLVRMNLEASWLFLLLCASALALGASKTKKKRIVVLARRDVI